MDDNRWNITYEQLNQRSRWYSSQLWYIPFAYLGIVGIGLEKILKLSYPLNSLGLVLFSIFSISVFVHVSSIKFYERRTVRSMQEIEDKPISGGGRPWYISFDWYIRLMIGFASYFFFAHSVLLMKKTLIAQGVILGIIYSLLTILYIVIVRQNHIRSRDLLRSIREGTR